jgi:hypothetical protein
MVFLLGMAVVETGVTHGYRFDAEALGFQAKQQMLCACALLIQSDTQKRLLLLLGCTCCEMNLCRVYLL